MNISPRHVKVLIVGSGFAGLGMGIRLKRAGEDDFLIVERADDVGGTWRDNTYPGVACDIPSHLYSFSFRPNPDWTRVFSPGAEILAYLKEAAREEGLLPHLRLQTEMLRAQWSGERWEVQTTGGTITANFLITGTGHLADEAFPTIPGLSDFQGEKFHSARWDHSVDLSGLRIGVVGTGASAIQIVPEMAKVASQLIVFQRTPPYIVPREERPYTAGEQRLFRRSPEELTKLRADLFWSFENGFAQRLMVPEFVEAARELALGHLRAQIEDPVLRAKLTPHYDPGCKRMLVSNAFYPALLQPNVTLEDSALERVDGAEVVAASGRAYELDVLIFATGFQATQPRYAHLVHDKRGTSLAQRWENGMQAYRSMSVAGFPNFFSLNGPNSALGHNSNVYTIEAQIEYVLGALDYIRARGAAVMDVTPRAENEFAERLQRNAQNTVWVSGGCQNWYVDERSGRLTLIWPDSGYAFSQANGRFRPEGYHFVTSSEMTSPAATSGGAPRVIA